MNEQESLARRVLEACRNQLFFENRFLEQALFRLKWEDDGAVCFGSEGSILHYSTNYILERYMQNPQQLMTDYLHTVMHCLYQHPFFVPQEQTEYWDLAADIAVECAIAEIVTEDDTEQGQMRRRMAGRIKGKINVMSVQKIFVFLLRNMVLDEDFQDFFGICFEELRSLFKQDDHSLWYLQNPDKNAAQSGMAGNQKQLQQLWKGVAEHVLMESQSFAKRTRGDLPGNMVQTLQKLTRENYDYSTFLLKFAAQIEERMQIDLDEFDYIFYTYGLKLDKRMLLIEPLEYKEKYLLREFVIAIDTSGSCEGELVEKFLIKTYNILRQTESFTTKVNIHIIQCDAAIQEDVVIQSQKDLENYIAHLELKGFGGTDFRPVFTYIENMFETGKMRKLEGLLYFTDGYGIFPEKPTKYKTAFVFLNQDGNVKVPAWAMKVYLEEEAL